jgi:hypothetical protein
MLDRRRFHTRRVHPKTDAVGSVYFGQSDSLLFTDVNAPQAAPEGGLRDYNVRGSKGG